MAVADGGGTGGGGGSWVSVLRKMVLDGYEVYVRIYARVARGPVAAAEAATLVGSSARRTPHAVAMLSMSLAL